MAHREMPAKVAPPRGIRTDQANSHFSCDEPASRRIVSIVNPNELHGHYRVKARWRRLATMALEISAQLWSLFTRLSAAATASGRGDGVCSLALFVIARKRRSPHWCTGMARWCTACAGICSTIPRGRRRCFQATLLVLARKADSLNRIEPGQLAVWSRLSVALKSQGLRQRDEAFATARCGRERFGKWNRARIRLLHF